MRILRGFLSRERSVKTSVLHVEGLALRLHHPHRDGGVGQAGLVEMEHEFLTVLEFGFHGAISFMN